MTCPAHTAIMPDICQPDESPHSTIQSIQVDDIPIIKRLHSCFIILHTMENSSTEAVQKKRIVNAVLQGIQTAPTTAVFELRSDDILSLRRYVFDHHYKDYHEIEFIGTFNESEVKQFIENTNGPKKNAYYQNAN